eukprot:IDg1103t1
MSLRYSAVTHNLRTNSSTRPALLSFSFSVRGKLLCDRAMVTDTLTPNVVCCASQAWYYSSYTTGYNICLSLQPLMYWHTLLIARWWHY